MSKRRAVILSVTVEGLSPAATARLYGLSEATVSRLLARYRTDGDAAFEPRSRRPRTSPSKVPATTEALIVNLRLEGPGSRLRRAILDRSIRAPS